mgnify:CR=1 FL=1
MTDAEKKVLDEEVVVESVDVEVGTMEDVDAIMKKFDRESNTRVWEGTPKLILRYVLAAFMLFMVYMNLWATWSGQIRRCLFVGFVVLFTFFIYPVKKGNVKPNSMPWYDILLAVAGCIPYFYYVANFKRIVAMGIAIGQTEVILGIIGTLVLAECCRRAVGLPILVVAGCFVLYAFIGRGMSLDLVVYNIFYTTNGIIGTPISVCSTYIALFLLFGAFLEATGVANFFIDCANALVGWASGGPAKVAVVSSALCGMVSGSSVGNTVTTGSVTIPMMKKTGYPPEFAGAVEAASSTGGQIMPPIMGAAAFLMAEYMKLPYAQVAVKAILPALLYFTGIFIAVHLEAKKLGLKGVPREELPAWRLLARDCYLIIPLILLVWLVSSGSKTMSHSAAYSILAAIAVGFVNFFLQGKRGEGDTQPMTTGKALGNAGKRSVFSAVESLEAGSRGAITVAVACSMAGIIAGCITVTGLASILINAIVQLAGNATIVGLVLTMLCCIVLGMGVPTTANYCIMASTCAPILIQLGFPLVAAHFFVFYFGIVADITPPVALAAYAGSAIAKSDPMKTGINATKLAIAAFIVPYIFAYSPALLFENISGWWEVAQICVSALLGIFAIAASLNGHLYKKVHWALRIVLAVGGLGMMIPGTLTDAVGLVLVAAVIAYQKISAKKHGGPVMTA